MTDEEFKKITNIQNKILIAYNIGMDESVIDMMQTSIADIERAAFERDELESISNTGCVIDTSAIPEINAVPVKLKNDRTRRRRRI